MTAPTAVLLSYRLGGADGVAVESAKWEWALRSLGFATRRVAGHYDDAQRPDDTALPFLRIDGAGAAVDRDGLARAVIDADLIVVENICSLPVNPVAATVTGAVLATVSGLSLIHI